MSKFLVRLRVPFILATLGLILYYTLYLAVHVPYLGFEFGWVPDSVATIIDFGNYVNSPAEQYLQPDDVLLAIDGEPVRRMDWRPLFPTLEPAYEYTVKRGDRLLTFTVPVAQPTPRLVGSRVVAGTVGLAAWIVGMLIIAFATPRNREAWRVGFVTMGMALTLTASEATLYGVPGAWLGSDPLLPIMAVGFAEIALQPFTHPPGPLVRRTFQTLYVLSVGLGLAAVFEIIYLAPLRTSFEVLIGVSLGHLILLFVGLGLLANPILAIVRYVRVRSAFQRRQILILIVFTALAVLPLVFLSILPVAVLKSKQPLLPWEVSLALLILIPAAYGYVIYRRKYLGLDLFATRTLTLLIVGLIFAVLYSLLYYPFRNNLAPSALEPLPAAIFFLAVLLLIPRIGGRIRRAVETLLFGSETPYQVSIGEFAAALAVDPEISTLKRILRALAGLLQVRQAALLLTDHQGQWTTIESTLPEPLIPPAPRGLPKSILVRSSLRREGKPQEILERYLWAEILATLTTRGTPIGLLLLGPPVSGGAFHARQITYVRQVADMMAVAADSIQLFESLREMARELLRVQETERVSLATEIHDEPLQRISLVVNALGDLSRRSELPSSELDEMLKAHKQSLRLACTRLREICAGLYSPVLEQGIEYAIKASVASFRSQTQMDIELVVDVPEGLEIPRETASAVQHVLIEALNNIRKHATAGSVQVELSCQDGYLRLSIQDDGCGEAWGSLSMSDLARAHHFGVLGMHEWARLVNGNLVISESEGCGTRVLLEAPVQASLEAVHDPAP